MFQTLQPVFQNLQPMIFPLLQTLDQALKYYVDPASKHGIAEKYGLETKEKP